MNKQELDYLEERLDIRYLYESQTGLPGVVKRDGIRRQEGGYFSKSRDFEIRTSSFTEEEEKTSINLIVKHISNAKKEIMKYNKTTIIR